LRTLGLAARSLLLRRDAALRGVAAVQRASGAAKAPPAPGTEAGSYLRLMTLASLSLRFKDLLGPVTRVKKKKREEHLADSPAVHGFERREAEGFWLSFLIDLNTWRRCRALQN